MSLLVIGLGNEFRGDDIAGLLVVRKLKRLVADRQVDFYEHSGEASFLISLWSENAENSIVFIVDGVSSQDAIGTIHRFDLQQQTLATELFYSTHAFNLAEAIELARILNQLPKTIIFYGVTGKNFQIGSELSLELPKAIDKLVEQMVKEIENLDF
ncbi:MAG: hydrogenase maturation protease [Blastocatellia bacterium]|nr:hydrogenase maturation protease [Blastocatellia bacterium]MBN8724979.1 hydrogenase maturation protease [Acidobacteriota bacterium]